MNLSPFWSLYSEIWRHAEPVGWLLLSLSRYDGYEFVGTVLFHPHKIPTWEIVIPIMMLRICRTSLIVVPSSGFSNGTISRFPMG